MPVALLAIGMTLVIATGGIDLGRGDYGDRRRDGGDADGSGSQPAGDYTGDAGQRRAVRTVERHPRGVAEDPAVRRHADSNGGGARHRPADHPGIVTFDSEALGWIGSGAFALLPVPVWIAAAMALLVWLLTRKTALGLFIEAVGINLRAARNAGVNGWLVVMSAYLISGFCAAVAGLIVAADIRGADANNAGLWLELDAIGGSDRRRFADGRAL